MQAPEHGLTLPDVSMQIFPCLPPQRSELPEDNDVHLPTGTSHMKEALCCFNEAAETVKT